MELGKIEKPKVEDVLTKRKIYCVNHIFGMVKDEEFTKLIERYWSEIDEHLDRLEIAGKVKKIFVEGLVPEEQDLISSLKDVNEGFHSLVKKRVDDGGIIIPIEEKDTFSAYMDLRNCLFIVRNREVYRKIFDFYKEVAEKRFEYMKKTIAESIEEGEAALLVMDDGERTMIEFPEDVEVFLVVPPSYDDILRWLRKERK